jgi:hypothetical protein
LTKGRTTKHSRLTQCTIWSEIQNIWTLDFTKTIEQRSLWDKYQW